MPRPQLLDRVAALADSTRCRILLMVERHELTVSELCTVLQLPQSTVSRHLKLLGDQAWLRARREGTRRFYSLEDGRLGASERRMWLLIRDEVAGSAAAEQDRGRLRSVLQQRRRRSEEFFASSAEWERLRRQQFGHRFDLLALLGLLDASWSVGDLGCGTGLLSEALALYVDRVVAVDSSPAMLEAAAERLAEQRGVEVRRGELEALPIGDRELDAATLVLVLHHVAEPGRVIREAFRVLRPGGVLLIVDMLPHDRDELRQEMGHVWLGFSEAHIERHLAAAGFDTLRLRPLPADPDARGPNLFVASARRAQPAVQSVPPEAARVGDRQHYA